MRISHGPGGLGAVAAKITKGSIMPFDYDNGQLLFSDDFEVTDGWHHEGIGRIERASRGGMSLACRGSRQGGEGCMAFFREDLPDCVAVEYDLTVLGQGGLVINYIAMRGLNGEDMIRDAADLEPRTGIMANYFGPRWGLQSYHVSISRFNDRGEHTGTSNWRRNPGSLLIGHGADLVREMGRGYRIRIVKDKGHAQLFVDGRFAHAFVDRDGGRYPIPDRGKFGFRLIGADVRADVRAFRVYAIESNPRIWRFNTGE